MERLDLSGLNDARRAEAVDVLEADGLVILPELPFKLHEDELGLLDPALLKPGVKNISLDPVTGRVGGCRPGREAELRPMLARYAEFAHSVIAAVAPRYPQALQRRRTSFRPGPVESRVLSPRKDDRRLHLDAFPANPVQGRRILRVFTNVDPGGRDRVWEVGETSVEALAARYSPPFHDRGAATRMQQLLGAIKGRRTAYDAAMLTLHDQAKLDDDWQRTAPRTRVGFPPGATWVVFTDGALHAALSGQHAFEQTWLLPVDAMARPGRSPLRRLEAVAGCALV